MGAYLRGNKLEFGRKYKIVEDLVKQQMNIIVDLPTRFDRTLLFNGRRASTGQGFKIKTANILLTEDFETFETIENLNVNLFSFENAYFLFAVGVGSSSQVNYIVPFSSYLNKYYKVTFSESGNYINVITTQISAPPISDDPWGCGIWGILKYNNKYVLYSNNETVSYLADYAPSTAVYPNNNGNLVNRPRLVLNEILKNQNITNISSEEKVSYSADSQNVIGYLLTCYFQSSSFNDTTTFFKGEQGYDWDPLFEIGLKTMNRRIENA